MDQALNDLVAAELVAAADTVGSPAFGVSHTGSDPRTTATSSLMCVICSSYAVNSTTCIVITLHKPRSHRLVLHATYIVFVHVTSSACKTQHSA